MFPKIGDFTPKMDGFYFMEKPYEQMDDFGGFYHYFGKHPNMFIPRKVILPKPLVKPYLEVGEASHLFTTKWMGDPLLAGPITKHFDP